MNRPALTLLPGSLSHARHQKSVRVCLPIAATPMTKEGVRNPFGLAGDVLTLRDPDQVRPMRATIREVRVESVAAMLQTAGMVSVGGQPGSALSTFVWVADLVPCRRKAS